MLDVVRDGSGLVIPSYGRAPVSVRRDCPTDTRRMGLMRFDVVGPATLIWVKARGVQGGPNPGHFGGGNTGHCGGHWPGLEWAKLLISTSASRFLAFGSAMAGAASL